jgi:hypothetical protein
VEYRFETLLICLQIWLDTDAEKSYEIQRQEADYATRTGDQTSYFGLYRRIVTELAAHWSFDKAADLNVLDICMAPGGFSKVILRTYPKAKVYGLSLPFEKGGHRLSYGEFRDLKNRFEVHFCDITMLAACSGNPELVPMRNTLARFCPSIHIET